MIALERVGVNRDRPLLFGADSAGQGQVRFDTDCEDQVWVKTSYCW